MAKINKSFGLASKIGLVATTGLNLGFGIADYKDNRRNGDSNIIAAGKAIGNFALDEALGLWSLPFRLAPEIPGVAVAGYEALGKLTRQMNYQSKQVPFVNSKFNDYSQAFTMRQAGMQMAQASRYKTQQAMLGNEAQYLRR